MMSASAFRPMGASIFESPQREVIVGKQAIMANYGHEVRGLLAQFDSELTKNMVSAYQEIEQDVLAQVEATMIERELNVKVDENALDADYFNAGNKERFNQVGLSDKDDWDTPAP